MSTQSTSCRSAANVSHIPPFMDKIPPEIRKQIYKAFFKSSTPTITGSFGRRNYRGRVPGCVNLLLTCKKIYDEAEQDHRTYTEFQMTPWSVPFPRQSSLPMALRISNLTIESSNQYYLNLLYADLLTNYDSLKMESLTIVSQAIHGDKFVFMSLLAPWNPLGNATKKLTQIVDLNNVSLSRVLRAVNPDNFPPYSPVRIAVIETVQNAVADVKTKLYIYAPLEFDVRNIYDAMMEDLRGRPWLLSAEIVVYLTNSWPYKTFKAGYEEEEGKRVLTW